MPSDIVYLKVAFLTVVSAFMHILLQLEMQRAVHLGYVYIQNLICCCQKLILAAGKLALCVTSFCPGTLLEPMVLRLERCRVGCIRALN